MKTRKFTSLLLTIIFLLAMLFGCANEVTEPSSTPEQTPVASDDPSPTNTEKPLYPLTEDDITLEWWMPLSEEILARMVDFEKNYAWNTLSSLTGVKFEFTTPSQMNQVEQFNLMIASNDYPDLIRNIGYPGGGDKGITDGVFLRLNDLIDKYAPNYTNWRNYTDEIYKTTVTDAGNVYQMQMIFDTRQAVIFGMMIRQDWLDDLGLERPETISDWHTVLTEFKEKKTTGGYGPMMLGSSGFNIYDTISGSAFGVGGSNEALSFILKDGNVTFSALEPEFKDYVETMRQWYSEGLIDQDFTVSNLPGVQKELIVTNKIGAANMIFTLGGEYWKDAGADPGTNFSLCSFPVKEEGGKPLHGNLRDQSPPDTGIAVSTDCEYPEIAVQVLDYYYSEEGALLANYGIEGITFDYNDEGKPVLKELITRNPEGLSMTAAQGLYLVHSGAMVFMLGREEDTLYPGALEYKTLWNVEFPRQLPNSLSFTEEESIEKTTIMGDVITYLQENTCKFIMGQKSMDEYDAFVKQFYTMNIDRAIEIYQTSYDRYLNR
jgi:putative aldouronate transport system substrate-binding protein